MNLRSYKIIFVLLSSLIVLIILLQALWIRYSFKLAEDELKRKTFNVLQKTGEQLNEREQMLFIKQSVFQKMKLPKWSDKSDIKIIINKNGDSGKVKIQESILVDTNVVLHKADTVVHVHQNKKTIVVRSENNSGNASNDKKVNDLFIRMMSEVEQLGPSVIDSIHTDTLESIIKKNMKRNGIEDDFEFELKRKGKNELLICKSGGFNAFNPVLETEISGERLFDRNIFLSIQLSNTLTSTLLRMKGILIVSGILTLILLTIFYFTVNRILAQKRLGEMKNDFINNMAHELKTPIATTSLVIDSIKNPKVFSDEAKLLQYLAILRIENNKLLNNVERVMQMAQNESGVVKETETEICINDIIQRSFVHLNLLAKNKNASFKLIAESKYYIHGNEAGIQMSFDNLIDNAIKYGFDKNEIRVDLQNQNNILRIQIKDYGPGIPLQDKQRIFEKFYRVTQGDVHEVKGFGIGLSFVKMIIEKHKGKISLNTSYTKGACFDIELPLARKEKI